MNFYEVSIQAEAFLTDGGVIVEFRGNERRALKSLRNAIQRCQNLDVKRATKTDRSRLSDTYIFPSADTSLVAAVALVKARAETLLLL